jgi:peptidoglycan/LPS O-acetylase OafA/YrhL
MAQRTYRPFGTFRLFLALLVVLQHYMALAPHCLGQRLQPFELGSLAVYVFFVASGYIISEAAHRFYSARPIAFVANRLIRILPIAVVAIAGNVGIWASLGAHHGPDVVLQELQTTAIGVVKLFPFTRSLELGFEPLPVAWALRVEFMFYLLCGAVLAIQQIAPATSRFSRASLFSFVALLGAAFLFDVAARQQPTMLRFIPYFALGASCYFAEQWAGTRRDALVVALIAVAGIALEQGERPPLHETAGFARDKGVEFAILSIMIAVLVCLSVCQARGRFLSVDHFLGDLSYPVYVGHFSVFLIWSGLFQPSWLSFASAWPCAALVSLGFHLAVEQPISRLRTSVRGQAIR